MLHESGEALIWKVGGVRSLITTSAIAKKEHSKVAPEISDLAQLQVLPQEKAGGHFHLLWEFRPQFILQSTSTGVSKANSNGKSLIPTFPGLFHVLWFLCNPTMTPKGILSWFEKYKKNPPHHQHFASLNRLLLWKISNTLKSKKANKLNVPPTGFNYYQHVANLVLSPTLGYFEANPRHHFI